MEQTNPCQLAVLLSGGEREKAIALSARLGCPLTETEEGAEVCLSVSENGISLIGEGLCLYGDYTRLEPRLGPNNLGGELLIRAAKPKLYGDHPTALDATAGMGEDAFLLAAAGFTVTLYENDPVMAVLLEDTVRRAKENPRICGIAARMTVIEGDSIEAMRSLKESPDIIYLDPMFPERKKSGLVGKKFQLIHTLEAPCDREEKLLEAALSAKPKKVIVKRPAKGPFLAGVRPNHSLPGKAIRYDCLLP